MAPASRCAGADFTLWLAEDAIWLTVFDQAAAQSPEVGRGRLCPLARGRCEHQAELPGANPHHASSPSTAWRRTSSFFTGSDPAKWRADVPAWGGVRYVELYPGIDLELTGEQGRLVPRLVARPART